MKVIFLFVINLLFIASISANSQEYNINNIKSASELNKAVEKGNLNEVITLLRSGLFNINSKGEFGETALMKAAGRGHSDIVELLLKLGADVNITDLGGETALHIAAKKGHTRIVDLLLKNSAQINAPDIEGWTPIMRAASNNKEQVVKSLLENNVDILSLNNIGDNVLTIIAPSGNTEILSSLENHSSFSDITDAQVAKSLSIAEKRNRTQFVEQLNKYNSKNQSANNFTDLAKNNSANPIDSSIIDSIESEIDKIESFEDFIWNKKDKKSDEAKKIIDDLPWQTKELSSPELKTNETIINDIPWDNNKSEESKQTQSLQNDIKSTKNSLTSKPKIPATNTPIPVFKDRSFSPDTSKHLQNETKLKESKSDSLLLRSDKVTASNKSKKIKKKATEAIMLDNFSIGGNDNSKSLFSFGGGVEYGLTVKISSFEDKSSAKEYYDAILAPRNFVSDIEHKIEDGFSLFSNEASLIFEKVESYAQSSKICNIVRSDGYDCEVSGKPIPNSKRKNAKLINSNAAYAQENKSPQYSDSGYYLVNLGSYESAIEADTTWLTLKNRNYNILKDSSPVFESNGRDIVLYAGKFYYQFKAEVVCNNLSRNNIKCSIEKR